MVSFFRHPNYYKNILHSFLSSIGKSKKNIIFDDKKINKSNFLKNKKVFSIYDIEIDNILILKKNLTVRKALSNTFLEIK